MQAILGEMRLVRTAALAMLVVAVGCASFGEGRDDTPPPSPPVDSPDAASDAGDLGPIPEEEPVTGNKDPGSKSTACLQKVAAGAIFCSDFDDGIDPWVGWDRDIPLERYATDSVERISSPNAALLAIKASSGSPDLRLKHELPPQIHFTFRGALRLSSPTQPPTDAVIMKLQFQKGGLFFRSTGRAIETIPQSSGPAKFVERLPNVEIPLDKWLDVELVVDLPTGKFDLSVGASKRSGTMDTKRAAPESVLLIVGPMDPRATEPSNLTMRLDDVFVTSP